MAQVQYTSLAKALYDKSVDTICPDDADCTDDGGNKVSSLISAGYKYLAIRESDWSCDGSPIMELGRIELNFPKWDDSKNGVPFQTEDEDCADGTKSEERRYGFKYIDDNYWHNPNGFEFFGPKHGFNDERVYYESIGLNKKDPFEQFIDAETDDAYENWDTLGTSTSTMYVGRDGEPIVYINGKNIISYVDVKFYGSSDCATILGDPAEPDTFNHSYPDTDNYTFDNNFGGQSGPRG